MECGELRGKAKNGRNRVTAGGAKREQERRKQRKPAAVHFCLTSVTGPFGRLGSIATAAAAVAAAPPPPTHFILTAAAAKSFKPLPDPCSFSGKESHPA